MKQFKKLLALTVAALMVGATLLTGCSGNDTKETTTADTEASESVDTTDETSAQGEADDKSWTTVEAAGVFKMGLDDNFPPMGFRNENNEITGFDVDCATEVAKRMGVQLELIPIDWTMKENELDGGNIDCIWNGYSFSEERNAKQTLTKPYMKNEQVVVVMAASGIKDLAGMAGMKLAIQDGSTAQGALDKAVDFKDSLGEVVGFKDNVTAFLDVEAGSTDGILLDSVVADYYIAQKDNSADYLVLDESLESEEYVIGFRKGDEALKNKVEETLAEMAADGTLATLSDKWFGEDVTVIAK